MTVPTLPGTPWPPPLWIFIILDYGGEFLAYLLLLIILVVAYPYSIWRSCIRCYKICSKKCCKRCCSSHCKSKCKCCNSCCKGKCTWIVDLLTKGSRILHVLMFPNLFKKHKDCDWHKTRSNSRRVTREFILFLDRRVESNFQMIISFYFLSLAIFSTGLLAFFRYIPVDISSECLRTDDQDQDLFCYTNGSTWPLNWSAFPVDCAKYNSTDRDIQEIYFVCYTVSYTNLGIAIAAAAALAKVVTVGITIYIRVSEFVYKKSLDVTSKCPRKCYISYNVIIVFVLGVVLLLSWSGIAKIIVDRVKSGEEHQLQRTYIAYALLPLVLLPPLIIIMSNFHKHCEQEEYISFCQDQLPPSPDACDVLKESNCTTQANPTSRAVTYNPEAALGESHDVRHVPTESNWGKSHKKHRYVHLNETEETHDL